MATIGQDVGLLAVFRQPRISFASGSPNTVTLDPSGPVVRTLRQGLRSYSHVKSISGGMLTANIGTMINPSDLAWWATYGAGLVVEVVGPEQDIIWEGYVSRMTIGIGGLSYTIGPLAQVANRVSVIFSELDTSTDPPSSGVKYQTAYAEDEASQRQYGVIEKVLSTGTVSVDVAGYIRDLYLQENAWPAKSNRYTMGSVGSELGLSLSCLGWYHKLGYTYYAETSGGQDLSAKIGAILDAEPNGIFSSDNAVITSNTAQVQAWETGSKTGKALIKAMLAMGDASLNRYMFTVGKGREVRYEQVGSEPEYQVALSDPSGSIKQLSDGRVAPWRIEPGKWVWYTDLLPGTADPNTQRRMSDRAFIDQITYTAPYGVVIQSGAYGDLAQMVAQLGISGIG